MRTVALILFGLACASRAWRAQRKSEAPLSEAELRQLQALERVTEAAPLKSLAALLLLDDAAAWQLSGNGRTGASAGELRSRHARHSTAVRMGRKFENNKLKMAKTALAKAKSSGYIGKKVVMAVKSGGGDPKTNLDLAKVMQEARAMGVPNAVVDKNIKKGLDTSTANYQQLVYEAYGPGGTGVIINCLSDNNKRANSEVNNAIKKGLGKKAAEGSVLFNFQKRARLAVNDVELDEDTVVELALEGGVEGDVALAAPDETLDDEKVKTVVLVEPNDYGHMQDALNGAGHDCSGRFVHLPMATVEANEEDTEILYALVDKLEDLDDVDFVEHNLAVSKE